MLYSGYIPTFTIYGGIKMDYRRLISFGKSSFVVSLPKGWVVQNKLKKGDLIYFEESGPNLVLTSNADTSENKDKEAVINVDAPWYKFSAGSGVFTLRFRVHRYDTEGYKPAIEVDYSIISLEFSGEERDSLPFILAKA